MGPLACPGVSSDHGRVDQRTDRRARRHADPSSRAAPHRTSRTPHRSRGGANPRDRPAATHPAPTDHAEGTDVNCQVCGRPSGRRDGLCHRHRVTPGTAARRRQYADQGYRKRRSAALAALADGDPCVRCGGPMYRGQRLDLDHDDHDRTVITGLAHASCNRRAGAVKANRQRRGIDPSNAQILDPTPNPTTGPRWQSRRWLPANGEPAATEQPSRQPNDSGSRCGTDTETANARAHWQGPEQLPNERKPDHDPRNVDQRTMSVFGRGLG